VNNFIVAQCRKGPQRGTLQSVSSDRSVSEMTLASECCRRCRHRHTCPNCAKDGYVNGEVGCSAYVTCASTKPADESHSYRCNKANYEPQECKKSQVLINSPDDVTSPGKMTECETHAQYINADNSKNGPHCDSEVHSDENCSLRAEISENHESVELDDATRPSDAASEAAEPCKSSVDTSSVSKSTRLNILSAAETFASIIGREIAASFDLKEGELSPADSRGDADNNCPLTRCSTTCITGSTRTLQAGLKLLDGDRKRESDKGPPLDTVEVARRVRDILTANNVGQRQFARYVLGLSQGTVSELLAKPKPWDRLTEKGKESYRRMNQWAADHLGVLSLKDHLNSAAFKANLPSPKGSYSCSFSVFVITV